jgi:hypothetical protein
MNIVAEQFAESILEDLASDNNGDFKKIKKSWNKIKKLVDKEIERMPEA